MKRNLISIDDLSIKQIDQIHDLALHHYKTKNTHKDELKNKLLINLFFENSTRTRTSFEIAAKRLGAEVVNINVALSSLKKGETIIDTIKTINAMNPDFVVCRHSASGILDLLEKYLNCPLINAGDGTNEHPTQALLDSFVIKQHKGELQNLTIAICGDTLHSRVARSNLKLLSKYGVQINVITAPTLVTKDYRNWLMDNWGAKLYKSLLLGIKDVDVIMMLRIQQERMVGGYLPSLNEYFKLYGLTHDKIKVAKEDVMVMHPGPINREVEISSLLADDLKTSLILDQVEAGVAIRQAILKFTSYDSNGK
jgi:aspartate carbamoyltransferase catalytic subunit